MFENELAILSVNLMLNKTDVLAAIWITEKIESSILIFKNAIKYDA
jgi:hypothetical protein